LQHVGHPEQLLDLAARLERSSGVLASPAHLAQRERRTDDQRDEGGNRAADPDQGYDRLEIAAWSEPLEHLRDQHDQHADADADRGREDLAVGGNAVGANQCSGHFEKAVLHE
jgi:hypothetical protein